MTNKQYLAWLHTRIWCYNNPNKKAIIITPNGFYEIKYILYEQLNGTESQAEYTSQEY